MVQRGVHLHCKVEMYMYNYSLREEACSMASSASTVAKDMMMITT